MFGDINDTDFGISEDLPPINPKDPDDEVRYFNYPTHQDEADAERELERQMEEDFLNGCFDPFLQEPDDIC